MIKKSEILGFQGSSKSKNIFHPINVNFIQFHYRAQKIFFFPNFKKIFFYRFFMYFAPFRLSIVLEIFGLRVVENMDEKAKYLFFCEKWISEVGVNKVK